MKHLSRQFNKSGMLIKAEQERQYLLAAKKSFVFFCAITSIMLAGLVFQSETLKAATGLGLVGEPTISLGVSSNNVGVVITPNTPNDIASGSHTLTASTNVATGYSLSLGALSAMPELTASTGTITTPVALSSNSWGFAINRVSVSSPNNTVLNGFDSSYTTPTPSSTSTWANPMNTEVIKMTTVAATNDVTTVYYGAKADITTGAGTYSSTVQYTAASNISQVAAPNILSVTPNVGTTAGGTAIEIVGTGFTSNDQSVTTAVTIGGQACENVSISSGIPAIGQDTIYCTTPVRPTAGAVDVSVTNWQSTATLSGGFTYSAPVPTINFPAAGQVFPAGTSEVTISVATNYAATCFYGDSPMPTEAMTFTGGLDHSVSLTGLANQSTNTYYVRCQAANGHSYSGDANVTFYVKAQIPDWPTLSPAQDERVSTNTATITVTSPGAVCTWGTSSETATQNASGTTKPTEAGNNTVYYSCITGSGPSASDPKTGAWSYVGYFPTISGTTGTVRGGNTLTINGTGFFAGGSSSAINSITVGGATCYVTTVTDTQAKCTLPTSLAAGTQAVAVNTIVGTTNTSVSYASDTGYTAAQCTALATNATATITDNRNGQQYVIKKLLDGKCWMISNLKYLPSGNAVGPYTLATSGNHMTVDGTDNRVGSNLDAPFYYNVPDGSSNQAASDFFGYLYNFYGATVGTGNSKKNWRDSTDSSLCPSPFVLPSGVVDGDLSNLDKLMGGTGDDQFDPSNPPTGVLLPYLQASWLWTGLWKGVLPGFWSGGHWGQYETARYWSSTSAGEDAGFNLGFDTYGSQIRPGTDASPAFSGFAIRCVLKP